MNREALYAALFAKFSSVLGVGFATKSRRLKFWGDVPSSQQPAVFQTQTKETVTSATGMPLKVECHGKLYLYARYDASTGAHPLNDAVDAITDAFNARNPVTGRVTLNVPGVEWAKIDGDIEHDEGLLGDQAVAIIPFTVLATDP